ncbi:MAG: hypothetical protein HXX14_04075 [Bacteroidetes bacterium]|nr:hypothetical protein [Bacteroidota bacterium]
MKLKLHHTSLICFLLISNLCFSQHKKDTASVQTPYLFPQFTEGSVIFKDGHSSRAMLNYETALNEMQFIGPDKVVLSLAEPDKVAVVNIADRHFINNKNSFVEILVEGTISLCLRVHQKRFAERIGAYGGTSAAASIGGYSSYTTPEGSMTKLTPHEAVSYQTEYFFYMLHYGKLKLVLGKRDLLRYFSSNAALLKQEIEKEHTNFSDIESMKKIFNWINANGIKD